MSLYYKLSDLVFDIIFDHEKEKFARLDDLPYDELLPYFENMLEENNTSEEQKVIQEIMLLLQER